MRIIEKFSFDRPLEPYLNVHDKIQLKRRIMSVLAIVSVPKIKALLSK